MAGPWDTTGAPREDSHTHPTPVPCPLAQGHQFEAGFLARNQSSSAQTIPIVPGP